MTTNSRHPMSSGIVRHIRTVVGLTTMIASLSATAASGQRLVGRVLDAEGGRGIWMAGVTLLNTDRGEITTALTDSVGGYVLPVPGSGEYSIAIRRTGYNEFRSPLVSVSDTLDYRIDWEITPEPVRLDPLLVAVRNERLEQWLTLRFGGNPNAAFGYRAIQGIALEEAKQKSEDNTELLRWLYIPVSHGFRVCLGYRIDGCGRLWVDDIPVPAEHIESVDMASIAVVVVFPPNVHLFTRSFDWSRRR